MDTKIKKAVIQYLESIVVLDPQINPQELGKCIYCGAALDEGQKHFSWCHYLEAGRLLKEFKGDQPC